MKQLIIIWICTCCLIITNVLAQEKPSIVIIGESYSCDKKLADIATAIANSVISANDRFQTITPETYRHVKGQLDQQRDEQYIYSEQVAEQFRAVGAQYMLYVKVVGCSTEERRNEEGKFLGYKGIVAILASVVDLGTTTTVFSSNFEATSSISRDRLSVQAKAAGSSSIERDIEKLIINAFPFEISIVKMTDVRGNKVKELLISGGSNLGIQKGNYFDVLIMDNIDGVPFEKNIGRVKVTELNGTQMSTAKPTNGANKILSAFNAKENIVLRASDHESIIDGAFNNIIKN